MARRFSAKGQRRKTLGGRHSTTVGSRAASAQRSLGLYLPREAEWQQPNTNQGAAAASCACANSRKAKKQLRWRMGES